MRIFLQCVHPNFFQIQNWVVKGNIFVFDELANLACTFLCMHGSREFANKWGEGFFIVYRNSLKVTGGKNLKLSSKHSLHERNQSQPQIPFFIWVFFPRNTFLKWVSPHKNVFSLAFVRSRPGTLNNWTLFPFPFFHMCRFTLLGHFFCKIRFTNHPKNEQIMVSRTTEQQALQKTVIIRFRKTNVLLCFFWPGPLLLLFDLLACIATK